jgi:hypothetical protein
MVDREEFMTHTNMFGQELSDSFSREIGLEIGQEVNTCFGPGVVVDYGFDEENDEELCMHIGDVYVMVTVNNSTTYSLRREDINS